MRKIGFTQTEEFSKERFEFRDVYDTMWVELLESIKFIPYPIPNSIKNLNLWMKKSKLDGIILTGGNDLSYLNEAVNPSLKRDELEFSLINYCINYKIPLLGVCRGMQIINYFFNGSLTNLKKHTQTNHRILFQRQERSKQKNVNSFHNWGIREINLSPELLKIAVANDGSIEAIKHKKFPILGIMWHPERTSNKFDDDDLEIIKDHFIQKVV